MHQIIFTSLPKTLTGGSGYGIAAATPDCPRLALEEVTKLAGYSEIYPASHPSKDQNPINYFFVKQSGFYILGRLSSAPNDYSGRFNYLGQFYIFGAESLPDCGPAELLKSLPFIDRFEGEARYLTPTSLPIIPKKGPIVCKSWQQWMGNAGWAGAAADQIMSGSQINILYATECRGQEALNLLAELFTLLPKPSIWQTTFATHVEGFPKGTATRIRMLQNGDRKTQDFQKLSNLFDMTKVSNNPLAETPLVAQARTGSIQEPTLKFPNTQDWAQIDPSSLVSQVSQDVGFGNDHDWQAIQPESIDSRSKNKQKIQIQQVPPPVTVRKTLTENQNVFPQNDLPKIQSNFKPPLSILLVILLISLMAGIGIGLPTGIWIQSKEEESIQSEKETQSQEIKDFQSQLTKQEEKTNSLKEELEKNKNEILSEKEKSNKISIDLGKENEKNKKLIDDIKDLTLRNNKLEKEKENIQSLLNAEKMQSLKDKGASGEELANLTPLPLNLLKELEKNPELSTFFSDILNERKEFAKKLSDHNFIKDKFQTLLDYSEQTWNDREKAIKTEKELRIEGDNSFFEARLNSVAQDPPTNSVDIITRITNLKALSSGLRVIPKSQSQTPLEKNLFWTSIQTPFGNFPAFRLSIAIKAADMFPKIKKTFNHLESLKEYDNQTTELERKNIALMIKLIEIFSKYKNTIPAKDK
jgi:hypothetical protein